MYCYLLIQLCGSVRVAETFVLYLSPGNVVLWWLHVDSKENMAKLAVLYVILSSYANSIVYLWKLQKSPKFAILVGWKSKICDFLHLRLDAEILTDKCTMNPSMVTDRIRSRCLIRFFFVNNMTCEALIAQDDTRRIWIIGSDLYSLAFAEVSGVFGLRRNHYRTVKFFVRTELNQFATPGDIFLALLFRMSSMSSSSDIQLL